MQLDFTPSDKVREIRRRIDHPVVDGDGHLIEVLPLVIDIIREIAGSGVA